MKILRIIGVILMLNLIVTPLYSVTAWPYPVEFTQPDGTKITVLLKGDEKMKWAETTDGYTILFNSEGFYEYAKLNETQDLVRSAIIAEDPEERSGEAKAFLSGLEKHLQYSLQQENCLQSIQQIYSEQAQQAFPTSGSRKLICILMSYADVPFTKTQADFDNLFNQIGYNADGATGSVRDFYKENSYNQLDLTVTVVGPYVANNNMAYYGANDANDDDTNPRALISEAVQKADADVNYADYDNDGNGYVDGVYVIFAGYGEEAGAAANAIWSHAWNISSLTLDGKIISRYSCSPELRGNTGTGLTRIGVICHEFGHVLGASDFYDTDYETNGQFTGTGKWDLMANGSWNNSGATPAHHNAYTKTQVYKWGTATTLSTATQLTLPNAETNNSAFYILNTTTSGEYFILENRQKTGFDAYLPGHGLIIYHKNKNGVNNTTYPQQFYPVCASATSNPGSTAATYGSINSGGCPFPGTSGKTSFTDFTTPYARSWLGAKTYSPITNISEDTNLGTITFDYKGNCTPPTIQASSFTTTSIADHSMTIGWNRGNGNSVLVIARTGSAENQDPECGTSYTANTTFGSGSQLGSGDYVVYSGTGNSATISGLTPGTTYYFAVYEYNFYTNCYLTAALNGSATTTGTSPCSLCASAGTMDYTTGITSVSFNTIANTTSKTTAYNDYTSLSTTVNKGSSYPLSVKLNTAGNFVVHTYAWIDWNQDCDFSDSGESYDLGTATNVSSGTSSLSPLNITIPTTALNGTTRLRISAKYSADPSSCETAFNGEVEDYTINVIKADPCYALNYLAGKATSTSGTYTDLGTNGTVITTTNFDDSNSTAQEIGFPFEYNCQTFTQFILNTNGFIKLGNTAPSSAALFFDSANTAGSGIFNSTNAADINLIGAFNHDLTAGTGTPEYRVYTSGTAPNRICTIQYKNVRDKTTSPAQQYDNMQFQIKLYETSKIIEFVYGDWTASANASAFKTSACGLKGSSSADNQLLVVNKGSATAWSDVTFSNANYQTTATLNFGNPTARPKPDSGRTFRFTPTYNNDWAVDEIYALGDASLNYSKPQSIAVNIANLGYNDLTNIPVTLNITGANTFTDTKYIASLDYGESKIVTFADFTPSANGSTIISVSVPGDDDTGNNTKTWVQNVNDFALNYSSAQGAANSYGWSAGTSGAFNCKYHANGSATVSTVKAFIGNNAASAGNTVYAILLNASGTLIGKSDNYIVLSGDLNSWHTFTITSPPTITDADFYAGLATVGSSTAYYPMGVQNESPSRTNTYYTSAVDGSTLTAMAPGFGYRYMIGLTFSSVAPVAGTATSDSPVCSGSAAMLTLSGYTGSIQWQQSADGTSNWTNVSTGIGMNTANYTTEALTAPKYYRAEISQAGYATLYSNAVLVSIAPSPNAAGTISGTAVVCQGQSSVNYTVPAIANSTSYIWTFPNGATGNSTTNSISLNYGLLATSGNITVKGHNVCSDGVPSTLAVTVNPLPSSAGTISGLTSVCQGQTAVSYSVPAIANASSYEWTLPTGASGTSITNSITVSYNTTAVSGAITVKGKNSCGDGAASSLSITVNPLPVAAGTIAGSPTVCQGQSSVNYTVPAITNATTYQWTLPTGASGASTTNSINLSYNTTAASGNITVCGQNSCGTGISSSSAITLNPLPIAAGSISGSTDICQGQTTNYTVPAITNATSYVWTLPSGVTGASTTNSIAASYGSSAVSGNISVKGNNSCGDGPVSNLAISVNSSTPASAGTISGTTEVCLGQTNVSYTTAAIANATTYVWTLPNGASGTSSTNSITVSYGTSAVSGVISVKGRNACGDGTSSSLAITVNSSLPSAAGIISGTTNACQGQSVSYTVPAISNASSYIWTLPTGATGTSTTNSITVSFGTSAISGMITVKGRNACGDGLASSLTITVNSSVPATAGAITGSTEICRGQNSVSYSLPVISQANTYEWTLPVGASGTSSSNNITLNYGSSAISGNIIVKGVNACGTGSASNLAITISTTAPSDAGTITGANTVCRGQNSVSYSVPAILNANSYEWTLPDGATGTSTTNSVTVNYGSSANSGYVTVRGVNACGYGNTSMLPVTVNSSVPSAAGKITGTESVCRGQSLTYSIPAIANANFYVWTLPNGASGTSSTNSILVTYGSSAVSGNISVYGINNCGNGIASSLAVTVNASAPDAAGAISGPTTVCPEQTNVTYTVPAIANATSYIWTLPSGASGTSSTNSIPVNFGSSAISGNITVKGINACGEGNTSSLAITINTATPENAGILSGPANVCQGQNGLSYTVPTISGAETYTWTLPNGASGTSSTNSITVNYGSLAVSGNISVRGNNQCKSGTASTLAVTVNSGVPDASDPISGANAVQQGQNAVIYSIPAIANATTYSWTLPSGASGSGTSNSISVNYGVLAISGTLSVRGINACGSGASSSLPITVSLSSPVAAGTISGPTTVCKGQTGVVYTVAPITNATSYIWTLPDGATGTSTTNSISIDFGTSMSSGTISVKGHNACGSGVASSLTITSSYSKPATPVITRTGDILQSSAANGNQWYKTNVLINGAVLREYAPTVKGDYSVVVSLNGCSSDPSAPYTFIPTGIEIQSNKQEIKVYPNPVTHRLTIECAGNKEPLSFVIYNTIGQAIFNGTLLEKTTVQTDQFKPGAYLVKIGTDKASETRMIIKE